MANIDIIGYVKNVRVNNVNNKTVANVKINVPTGTKENRNYINFDVAFWEESSIPATKLREGDYISVPRANMINVEAREYEGKIYTTIKCFGNSIFKAFPKEDYKKPANNSSGKSLTPANAFED